MTRFIFGQSVIINFENEEVWDRNIRGHIFKVNPPELSELYPYEVTFRNNDRYYRMLVMQSEIREEFLSLGFELFGSCPESCKNGCMQCDQRALMGE